MQPNLQYAKEFLQNTETGQVALELAFAGWCQDQMEKVVRPTGPTPGFRVQIAWKTKDDGQRVIRIEEVPEGTPGPAPIDELETMKLDKLVSLAVREGWRECSMEMPEHFIRQSIRKRREDKAKAAKKAESAVKVPEKDTKPAPKEVTIAPKPVPIGDA